MAKCKPNVHHPTPEERAERISRHSRAIVWPLADIANEIREAEAAARAKAFEEVERAVEERTGCGMVRTCERHREPRVELWHSGELVLEACAYGCLEPKRGVSQERLRQVLLLLLWNLELLPKARING